MSDPKTVDPRADWVQFSSRQEPQFLPRVTPTITELYRQMMNLHPSVPQGWKLVPLEPTQAMIEAARTHRPHPNVRKPEHWDHIYIANYRRMVGAAPSAPGTSEQEAPEPARSLEPRPVAQVLSEIDDHLQALQHYGHSRDLREAMDTVAQLQDVVRFLVHWHDQLTPADVQRAKAVMAKAGGSGS